MSITSIQKTMLAVLVGTSCWIASLETNAQTKPTTPALPDSVDIQMKRDADGVAVRIGTEMFTRFVFNKFEKPIFYPVLGPGGTPLTRNWPMKQVPGEAKDHPHHRSIWIGHEVNGLDFWANGSGLIEFQELESFDETASRFTVRNHWLKKSDRAIVMTERTSYRFGADPSKRWLDATIQFQATHGDVTFDDTKEGLFAIRTHPKLRLSPNEKEGVVEVTGKAVNSNGDRGKAVWGKSAKWVSYWGEIDGKKTGLALLDHPTNLRHPSTWHAREYGLIAVNPFGLHYFKNAEKGAGAVTLTQGETLTLRYRFVFYLGEHDDESVQAWFNEFAK